MPANGETESSRPYSTAVSHGRQKTLYLRGDSEAIRTFRGRIAKEIPEFDLDQAEVRP
jgi:hypothetical protein